MGEKRIRIGYLFIQEAIKAGIWGFILLLFLSMFVQSVKRDIREEIVLGVNRALSNSTAYVLNHPYLIDRGKQLIKEGIDYTITEAARGLLESKNVDNEEKIEN